MNDHSASSLLTMDGYKKSKINLSMLKGKPINSSVPSFRFNATAEELEELYTSEDELDDQLDLPIKAASDAESSPHKGSNKLSKRSTSVDVSTSDLSPPSDPWRFFTDIKGKITKSVEGKITEYKTRTSETSDTSPKKTRLIREGRECKEAIARGEKDTNEGSKESSLSDSDELSESSLSRTCGIVSTTEGVEMSSEEEGNASLSEKKDSDKEWSRKGSTKQRRKVTVITKEGKTEQRETTSSFLLDLQQLHDPYTPPAISNEIEPGIDVLAQINNITVDEDAISITQVHGDDIRREFYAHDGHESTTFAPTGFVDLRPVHARYTMWDMLVDNRYICLLLVALVLYLSLPMSSYMSGFVAGNVLMFAVIYTYTSFAHQDTNESSTDAHTVADFVTIPSVTEERPVLKYQGWANEYPDVYDPSTYHISQTQSVYLRLQANLLKISNTKQKIPKRAIYNEPEHKLAFSKHRIYNLIGAEILLLPHGLTKIRHWSKKYPICIILNKDQLCYEMSDSSPAMQRAAGAQVYSKLIEEAGAHTDLGERSVCKDDEDSTNAEDRDDEMIDDEMSFFDTSDTIDPSMDLSLLQDRLERTVIYIFARTDRDKEHWYRRFKRATHRDSSDFPKDYGQYINIMSQVITPIESGGMHSMFMNMSESLLTRSHHRSNLQYDVDLQWLSAFINRMTYDMHRSAEIIKIIHERVAKKLNAIKLPMFIESLRMTELTIGNHAPKILQIGKPYVDEWGLWVDFEVSYEGSVVLMVLTKLNLLKLKQQAEKTGECGATKSAIYHSDVEDTAESSSEDDGRRMSSQAYVDDAGQSKQNKKFLHIVDRFAESRFFQRAAENKFIKKAIEGVSNTDVGLKLEVKACRGCLVVNVPPPPCDRIWFGFRSVPLPKLHLTAQPVVGERNWNFMKVSNWIEKRVYKEFLKVLLLPNMEDIIVPGMDPQLPE